MNLKGPVMMVENASYTAQQMQGQITKSEDLPWTGYELTYVSESGLLDSIVYISSEREPEAREIISHDDSDRMSEIIAYEPYNSLKGRGRCVYNEKDQLIEFHGVNEDGTKILADRVEFMYKDLPKPYRNNRYDNTGNLDTYYLYTYNDNLELIKDESYDIHDLLLSTTTYLYNDHGDIIRMESKYPSYNQESLYIFTYEYDKWGNWIKKTRTTDSTSFDITERKITYYEK